MRKKAFTLIELVMVIAVIALLAAIIIPRFTVQLLEARISTTRANLQTLRSAISLFYANEGDWPAALDDLTDAAKAGITGTQYLRAVPPETLSGTNITDEDNSVGDNGGWVYDTVNHEVYVDWSSVPNATNRTYDDGTQLNPSAHW